MRQAETPLHYQVHEVEPYINWSYFLHAWGFPQKFSTAAHLCNCPSCREAWIASFPEAERDCARSAHQLMEEARQWLRQQGRHLQSHAIVGLYEANSDGEDIILYKDNRKKATTPSSPTTPFRLPLLRQQHGDPCHCWADYLPPVSTGQTEVMGLFATSVDEVGGDLLSQTLADRLAEATAERMHEEVRKTLWGYAKDEQLSVSEMLQEKYTGRRPAVGYPSLPDQSLNFLIDEILDMTQIGIRLTESGAMRPHASTSGLLFRHPEARHFAIGKIGLDQLRDYALRRQMPEADVRRFLAANL